WLPNSYGYEVTFSRPSLQDDIQLRSLKVFHGESPSPIVVFEQVEMTPDISQWASDSVNSDFRLRTRGFPIAKVTVLKCSYISKDAHLWNNPYEQFCSYRQRMLIALQKGKQRFLQRMEHCQRERPNQRTANRLQSMLRKFDRAITLHSQERSFEGYQEEMLARQLETLLVMDGFVCIEYSGYVEQNEIEESLYSYI